MILYHEYGKSVWKTAEEAALTKKLFGIRFATDKSVSRYRAKLFQEIPMKEERRKKPRNQAPRTIAVYLCRDRRLDPLKIALRKILGPEAYFFRPTGGGIDIGDAQSFHSFARGIRTLQKLDTGLIIALAHDDCHHCKVNNIISPESEYAEIIILKRTMEVAGQNIKNTFPTMKIITGIIHTEQARNGNLRSIELIAPYNDSSFLYHGRCTEYLHHDAFHNIAI